MKTYTSLISALGKQNKAKEAEEIFNQEARVEFDCDAAIFNAIAHGYCENDQPDEAMQFVDSWVEEIGLCDRPDMEGMKDKIAKPNRKRRIRRLSTRTRGTGNIERFIERCELWRRSI